MTAIILPYPPSANRYLRHTARGTYRTKFADEYRCIAELAARSLGMAMITTPVQLTATLHPKTTKKGAASNTRLDLDNCVKVACDALQGTLYANDKQIVRLVLEVGKPLPTGGLSLEVSEVKT